MIVCVDAGNTTINFGLYNESKLIDKFSVQTKPIKSSEEYGNILINHYNINKINLKDIKGIIISSVVTDINIPLKKMFKKYFQLDAIFVNTSMPLDININVKPVESLGADLLVGAYASMVKYGVPHIVIDMGTAITLMAVNNQCEFIGGVIYPGVLTSFSSLINSTSLLDYTGLNIPSNVINNETNKCLQSGMTYGTKALINGLVSDMKKEMNEENLKVILTGGTAKQLYSMFNDYIYDETLLLDGLNLIYQKLNGASK